MVPIVVDIGICFRVISSIVQTRENAKLTAACLGGEKKAEEAGHGSCIRPNAQVVKLKG